jgi:hypothetical protein
MNIQNILARPFKPFLWGSGALTRVPAAISSIIQWLTNTLSDTINPLQVSPVPVYADVPCVTFNGTDQEAEGAMPAASLSRVWELHCTFRTSQTNEFELYSLRDNADLERVALFAETTTNKLWVYVETGGFTSSSDITDLRNGEWHTSKLQVTASSVKLWVDDVQVINDTIGLGIVSIQKFHFGSFDKAAAAGADYLFDG